MFVNYKVAIQEDEHKRMLRDINGKLKRTYKLIPGIAHQHIAHEVLKEQGECSPFFMKNIAIQ